MSKTKSTEEQDAFMSLAEMQQKCSMNDMMSKMISDFNEAEKNGFSGDFEDFQSAGEMQIPKSEIKV